MSLSKVRPNCGENFERSCNQVLLDDTFEKIFTITATEVILIHLLSVTIVSKQKIKIKTWNTMALSYHSKVTSTQSKGVPFFSCLAHGM